MIADILVKLESEQETRIAEIKKLFEDKKKSAAEHINGLVMLGKLGERALEAAKTWGTWHIFNADIVVDDVRDFKKIREAFGPVEKYNVEPVKKKHKTVEVTMRPVNEKFKNLRFVYQRKLKDSDKCKIVSKTVVEKRVVCSV